MPSAIRVVGLAGQLLIVAAIAGWLPAASGAAEKQSVGEKFAPDPASVTRHEKGWRYPQAGWIVVHVEGTPYDRGFQHGRLLAPEIAEYVRTLATIRSPKAPSEAWRDLKIMVNALFLRRYDVEYLEEMKGIADGAASVGAKFEGRRLDLLDIVAINSDVETSFLDNALEASATGIDRIKFPTPQFSRTKPRHHEHCSAFVATGPATADGKIVMGHITMSTLENVHHYNVWLDIQPATGHRMVFQTYPGGIQSGLDYYISDSGLVVSETTIRQTRFNPEGQALASRIRRAVQYAETIDQAVEILGDRSNGLYTNQWLLGDINTNEIAMFELGTYKNRLWRSSRDEWPEGTKGFYWGCNNVRDPAVYQETVPDLYGKPANLVTHPKSRDKAWLTIFEEHRGQIDEAFAFKAFTSPPLAAFPSCDAKFTTAALAKRLESWALFGPPLGRTWDPAPQDRKKYADVQPLVSNDWTLLDINLPQAEQGGGKEAAVDLEPFPEEKKELPVKFDGTHPFAWRGTLLPLSDADTWLAAGFAEYEAVVSLEKALHREVKEKEGELEQEARDLVGLALFAHESKWQAAARRLGRDVPFSETHSDPAHNEWYDIASGKGVLFLAALRDRLGAEPFDKLMDEFGTAHAGKPVATEEFRRYCEAGAGKPAIELFRAWHDGPAPADSAAANIWTIFSFEAEPEHALIVYGTLGDAAAQKEAAELLQREIARRFSNRSIPFKADTDVTDLELSSRHLLLVGRPATNRITTRLAPSLPVKFGTASFHVRGETYAHADSAIIVAGDNPLNPRYSAVTLAGLGARATWRAVQHLDADEDPPPQVLLFRAGQHPHKFRLDRPTHIIAAP